MHRFTESYIRLCRDYPLKREYEEGDWHWESVYASGEGEAELCTETCFHPQPEEAWVWIPRLDQLLDLLGAHGSITLLSLGTQASHGWICKFGNFSNNGAAGRTPEEAALHLLLSALSRNPTEAAE